MAPKARKARPKVDDAAREIELPPIPPFVFTALGEVPVLRVPKIICCDGKADEVALGYANYHHRTIQVRENLTPAGAWATLLHEQFHFWLFDNDVGLTGKQEEAACSAYATARFQEMVTRR